MKRLALVKTSPEIQLGHLYEHIFCAHIHTLMRQHHLFPRLDYSVDGTTYYGGIVHVDVELYTNAAIALTDQIIPLDITLNETTIFTATKQLLAEKEEPFDSAGYDNVKAIARGVLRVQGKRAERQRGQSCALHEAAPGNGAHVPPHCL